MDSRTPLLRNSALSTINTRTWQGHVQAALSVAFAYYKGQGVAVSYPRAMSAARVGGEGGDAACQYMVGTMYIKPFKGRGGVDADNKNAVRWFEKAAAQDHPKANDLLGTMYGHGHGVTPSWRRARDYYERAVELGNAETAAEGLPRAGPHQGHSRGSKRARSPPCHLSYATQL